MAELSNTYSGHICIIQIKYAIYVYIVPYVAVYDMHLIMSHGILVVVAMHLRHLFRYAEQIVRGITDLAWHWWWQKSCQWHDQESCTLQRNFQWLTLQRQLVTKYVVLYSTWMVMNSHRKWGITLQRGFSVFNMSGHKLQQGMRDHTPEGVVNPLWITIDIVYCNEKQ